VGSRTFGKGSVQMPTRLPDGSVAELTVGHYRTPSGHAVDGRGITPDLDAGPEALTRAETVLTGLGDAS
jgi:carboxyl-terminal processing protease